MQDGGRVFRILSASRHQDTSRECEQTATRRSTKSPQVETKNTKPSVPQLSTASLSLPKRKKKIEQTRAISFRLSSRVAKKVIMLSLFYVLWGGWGQCKRKCSFAQCAGTENLGQRKERTQSERRRSSGRRRGESRTCCSAHHG